MERRGRGTLWWPLLIVRKNYFKCNYDYDDDDDAAADDDDEEEEEEKENDGDKKSHFHFSLEASLHSLAALRWARQAEVRCLSEIDVDHWESQFPVVMITMTMLMLVLMIQR